MWGRGWVPIIDRIMIARAQLNVLHVDSICLLIRLLHKALAGGNLGRHECQKCAVWDTDVGCRHIGKKVISARNTPKYLLGDICSSQNEGNIVLGGQTSQQFPAAHTQPQTVELICLHWGTNLALTIIKSWCKSQLESQRRVLQSIEDAASIGKASPCDRLQLACFSESDGQTAFKCYEALEDAGALVVWDPAVVTTVSSYVLGSVLRVVVR